MYTKYYAGEYKRECEDSPVLLQLQFSARENSMFSYSFTDCTLNSCKANQNSRVMLKCRSVKKSKNHIR